MKEKPLEIRVWDPLVRIFHGLIVILVFTAFITEDDFQRLHILAGYLISGLVLLRFFWGIVGGRHARFSDFIFPPRVILAYLRDLILLKAPRYLGHGPAGGTMVIALLASLAGASLTGIALYGGQEYSGPLAGTLSAVDDSWILAAEILHEFFAGLIVFLVVFHVAGVLFSSFAHRENLIKSMWTGNKPVAPPIPAGNRPADSVPSYGSGILTRLLPAVLIPALLGVVPATAATAVDDLLRQYQSQGASDFTADSGRSLWYRPFVDTKSKQERSCTSCHRKDPKGAGKHIQTGKPIEPMAPSVNAKRLTDAKSIEKWFNRNCKWTLGRECSPAEKAGVLLFLRDQ